MNKTIITLMVASLLSSCSTLCNYTIGLVSSSPLTCITEIRDASIGAEPIEKDLALLKSQLIISLRDTYIVSEELPGSDYEVYSLTFETNVYESESKGIFGLGPKWEEKIQVNVVVSDIPEVGKYVRTDTLVYERQKNSLNDWERKNDYAYNRELENKILKDIEVVIRGGI